MLIKILIQTLSSIFGFFIWLFPPMPTSDFTLIDSITDFISPFTYTFALDHFLIAFSPLFLYYGYLGFINLISQVKLIAKWW